MRTRGSEIFEDQSLKGEGYNSSHDRDRPNHGRILAKRILAEHIAPYKPNFALACFFMVLAALATAALPYLLQPVFDDVFTANDPKLLAYFCGAVLTAFIVKGIASYGESVVMTYVGQKIISDIQNRLFAHLMKADLSFFHNTTSGDLLSRFTNDVNMMRNAMANTLIGLGKDSLTFLFLGGVMFYRDFTLALIAFVVFPIAILPITFQGIRVVKAYGMEQAEAIRAETMIQKIFKLIYKSARVRSASHPIMESLGGVAIIGVIAYGGWQVMHHSRTAGEFISFILALVLVYEPLKRLSNLNANLQEGLAAATRVFAILDTPPHITDPTAAHPIGKTAGKITFDHVSFCYPNGKEALKDLNFVIEPGHSIALVGSSGAGKSTIINLIPRFYDVSQGRILLDDQDIRHVKLDDLRHQIALVSQEIALFDLSIRDNIAYGTPNATNEQIISAAKSAAADEFIVRLPEGYETVIGENGVKLSGGQRQRLAIARAMLKNAPILLLDEATSALDTDSERQVQSALKILMQGRTTIMVAHRLSTVVDADIIYVLDHGEIVETGNHKALLKQKGIYANLWRAQSQGAA
ncbi:MAG: ABC transporter ATP-binding protein [Alphaproteobacteria bacterium]|nr:ABC transporter ATP-binding protein [Alphaproteobacteria bacterium]